MQDKWHWPRRQVEENSPSRKCGMPLKKETSTRRVFHAFIMDVGVALKMNPYAIATAIVYWQRFYLCQSLTKSDPHLIAAACLLLAGKVDEDFRYLKDVVVKAYVLKMKKDPAAVQAIKREDVFIRDKELVLQAEALLLQTLDFDLKINHPYIPLANMLKKLGLANPKKPTANQMCQIAWNFVNDSMRTTLCLQPYSPQDIAMACINLAAVSLHYKLPASQDGQPWWKQFGTSSLSAEALKDIEAQIMSLYKKKDGSSNTPSSCVVVSAVTSRPSMDTASAGKKRPLLTAKSGPLKHGESQPALSMKQRMASGSAKGQHEADASHGQALKAPAVVMEDGPRRPAGAKEHGLLMPSVDPVGSVQGELEGQEGQQALGALKTKGELKEGDSDISSLEEGEVKSAEQLQEGVLVTEEDKVPCATLQIEGAGIEMCPASNCGIEMRSGGDGSSIRAAPGAVKESAGGISPVAPQELCVVTKVLPHSISEGQSVAAISPNRKRSPAAASSGNDTVKRCCVELVGKVEVKGDERSVQVQQQIVRAIAPV
eukprot:SM000061S19272  [mRNA]  locus=s61:492086:495148:+ [translate_table: standard]